MIVGLQGAWLAAPGPERLRRPDVFLGAGGVVLIETRDLTKDYALGDTDVHALAA